MHLLFLLIGLATFHGGYYCLLGLIRLVRLSRVLTALLIRLDLTIHRDILLRSSN